MATKLSSLLTDIRAHLNAPVGGGVVNADTYWTDTELLAIINRGIKDLWRAINDNYQNYFLTDDVTNVSIAASTEVLTGVPADVSIVRFIGPRDPTAFPYLKFEYRDPSNKDWVAAKTQGVYDSSQARLLYYYISKAGAPVAAPEIHIAPKINAAIPLELIYVPVLADVASGGDNPIPGESDQALINWGVAWARAKEREDHEPDAGWLAMYKTEKQNILASLSPRQTADEEVAEAFFEEYW